MKKLLPLLIGAFFSGLANAGLYDSSPSIAASAQTGTSPSRIVPDGCSADQPIDSCAPSVKPFDCAPGRHWTSQGGNGLAHCVDDDPACPADYSLTHDSLGNPSCYYNPPPPPVSVGAMNLWGGAVPTETKPPFDPWKANVFYADTLLPTRVARECVANGTCSFVTDSSLVAGWNTRGPEPFFMCNGALIGYFDENDKPVITAYTTGLGYWSSTALKWQWDLTLPVPPIYRTGAFGGYKLNLTYEELVRQTPSFLYPQQYVMTDAVSKWGSWLSETNCNNTYN